jgi:integrase
MSNKYPRASTASVFNLLTKEGHFLPVLMVDDLDGGSRVVPEVIAFMEALVSQGESLSKRKGIANTLALLHDYLTIARSAVPLRPEDLPDVVASFLRRRRYQPAEADGLDWTPVRRATVDRDKHYLRVFSEFCASRFGHFPIVPLRERCALTPDSVDYRSVMRRLARKKNMLLGHIARPSAQSVVIGLPEKKVARRSSSHTFLSTAMAEDLILSTPSICQRIAFILAAFGGPRISEILNLWRCDVLPGRFRPTLFPDDKASEVPLVILAHPTQSLYVGSMAPGNRDRLQHLHESYNLKPRFLQEANSLKAGWKGMLFDNDALLISQVFWSDRSWARTFYELFQQLRDHILPTVPENVRKAHPHLIINDSPSRREFGQPMKMSNFRKAYERACRRIGVDANRFRDGVHGLRHLYKANLELLGLTPEEVRKAMHHISLTSQQEYGQSAARLNERLVMQIEK